MHEELIGALRFHGSCLSLEAADVIEELSRIERDFRQYISEQVNKTSGVYACRYCKNRKAFDEYYGCGCDHADCDGANEWEYGTPRKRGDGK